MAKEKRPFKQALEKAYELKEAISPYCLRVELGGSLRRERPFIGDIELVALPDPTTDLWGQPTDAPTRLDMFLQENFKLGKNGKKQKLFDYKGFQVDLFLPLSAEHWGCIYLIRTGSHEFNLWLMQNSYRWNVRFAEGRLYDRSGSNLLQTPEEADVFKAMGVPFVPVTKRDDHLWLPYFEEG
jgi:DNA polymerase (family X)